ncbi:hypothetical protein IW261DRAFT_1412976 [Armillaria novae-zelandiae]|uniref:Uncharacterized protein n=1 Tax=Armillaria novae-zelandiae TaxID=153914 RepID=A0AA39PWM3_9AGAR|nr:hypothetical protein IW261DRAFT_1412976 [Armillaria novae-zelandiae]
MRQPNSSLSLPKPTIHRYPQTPATGRAFQPVPTAPRQTLFPVSSSRQLVCDGSTEKKESAHPPATSSEGSDVTPSSRVSFLNFEVDTCQTPFQNPPSTLPTFSGIWVLHTAPHSSRVHHCAVYIHHPTKTDPQPFNEAKLKVCLSRHASDDIPLDVQSLRDQGKLMTLSDTCKVLDCMVIELNAGQKGGRIFLPSELAMMNQKTLDISRWTVDGTNTVRCIQLSDEAADVFILHASLMPSGIEKMNQSNTDVGLSQSNPYTSVHGTGVIPSHATKELPLAVDPQTHLPEGDEDFLRRCREVYGATD